MTRPVGRPPKFESPEELQELLDAHFRGLEEPKVVSGGVYQEPLTLTGLCLALGTTRETLSDYEKKPEYSCAIKEARIRVENFAERQLYLGKAAAGPIFALKNFGWRDESRVALGGAEDMPAIKSDTTFSPSEAYRLMLEGK